VAATRRGGALLGCVLLAGCAAPVAVLTPLPADTRVLAPAADVPAALAAFSGTWAGRYSFPIIASGRPVTMTQEIALVVERIRSERGAYHASVVFSWDRKLHPFDPPLRAGYQRHEVTLTRDGALRFRSGGDYGLHTFRVSSKDTLDAEQEDMPGVGRQKVYGVLWRVPPAGPSAS
jgi:hypothetical protein